KRHITIDSSIAGTALGNSRKSGHWFPSGMAKNQKWPLEREKTESDVTARKASIAPVCKYHPACGTNPDRTSAEPSKSRDSGRRWRRRPTGSRIAALHGFRDDDVRIGRLG